jgi:G6PDH family F420-dependent oxidoreductase
MTEFGYALSSEQFPPDDLVQMAKRAEEHGFTYAFISDHFHPWISRQGHSAFVWAVLGAIARETSTLRIATGVTCPLFRTPPAIVAHAAATVEAMMPGRFMLGVGTGEALNEHIHGDAWPAVATRLEMLDEAIDAIRLLWEGGVQSHRGTYFTIDNAQLFTLPPAPPPILVAASGKKAAGLAGRKGDALVSTSPSAETVTAFEQAGGAGKPKYAQMTVCYGPDEDAARKLVLDVWPNAGMGGQLSQDVPTPSHFESIAELVREEDVAENVVCGPDPGKHLDMVRQYVDAGFDHVFFSQIGPDQEGFLRFYTEKVLPKLDVGTYASKRSA